MVVRLDMQAACASLGEADRPLLAHDATTGRDWECRPERYGDVVLARREVPASYHLCVTHDDWVQGVTLVVRGEDLRPATGRAPVAAGPDGVGRRLPGRTIICCRIRTAGRLAKRDGAPSLRSMRGERDDARAGAGSGRLSLRSG